MRILPLRMKVGRLQEPPLSLGKGRGGAFYQCFPFWVGGRGTPRRFSGDSMYGGEVLGQLGWVRARLLPGPGPHSSTSKQMYMCVHGMVRPAHIYMFQALRNILYHIHLLRR